MLLIILLLSVVLLTGYAALILYYRKSWLSIPYFTTVSNKIKPSTKISVIIPARNEEHNIIACLSSVATQSYPKNLFEIIIVDDHSTDNTATLVRSFKGCHVKLISLVDFTGAEIVNAYKKKAIEIAISQSSGELIVTTDADCIVPHNWLQTIAAFYEQTNAAFIAMPVSFDCRNRFFEIFQSLDFMTLQGITGASVYKKFHSMCNGANLAYQKNIFNEVNGFKDIDNIASGDDMLLMHKIFKRYPEKVLFLKSTDVIVQTKPMATLSDFFNQRIRWSSKAGKYEDKSILPVLMLVYFFNVTLLLLPVLGLFNNTIVSILNFRYSILSCWLLMLLLKTLVELFFIYPVATFFNTQKLLWLFPVAQPFHILYTVIAGWLGKFGTYKWKDRNVK